jgi:hypothetical protein
MAYCSADEVKVYADIKTTDTSKDDLIESLILACQSFIDEYCNRSFEKSSMTEYFGDVLASKLFLSKYPIDTKKSIKVWDSWDRGYADSDLVDSSDYFVDAENGIIKLDYEVGGSAGSVKVTYSAGYLAIPSAINQACIELVARKLKEGPSGGLGVPSRALPGGGNVTFVIDALLPQTKIALDSFRKMVKV